MKTQRGVYRFVIAEDAAGERLDHYLPGAAGLSRSLVRRIIDFGGVHVNGRRLRTCSQPLGSGDRVELYCDGLPLTPFALTSETIIFRDSYILVVNKPAGIDCQPTPSRYKGTLYAALLELLADPKRPRQQPTIGMVQRLDRDTSGLLVFSTHPRAHAGLTRQFTERTVQKTYLAIVSGQMQQNSGEFRSLLAKNRATNRMRSVAKGGQEAITRYQTVAMSELASLVEIELLTGRTHQIRAHFAEAGHPLFGDVRYGGPTQLAGHAVTRQLLHAGRLSLQHPVSGRELEFTVPLPTDMAFFARTLFEENP